MTTIVKGRRGGRLAIDRTHRACLQRDTPAEMTPARLPVESPSTLREHTCGACALHTSCRQSEARFGSHRGRRWPMMVQSRDCTRGRNA